MKAVFRFALAPEDLRRMQERFPALEIIQCPNDQGIEAALAEAEIVIGGWRLPSEYVRAAPRLRWVQSIYTGVESFMPPELAQRGIVLTNWAGVSGPNMAEHVMAMMLAFARAFPILERRQAKGEWLAPPQHPPLFELGGQRLGLLGVGSVGRELARRAKAFDMEVWAIRRRPAAAPPGIDRLLPLEDLPELLAAVDHLVLALPHTKATHHILDAERLARLKPSAYLYNVGRGDLIDQVALIEALRAGRIAGAGLDVATPEPLPADSPLWQMPNVILTGHTSGVSPRRQARGMAIIIDNLGRYIAGETLRNVVDLAEGY